MYSRGKAKRAATVGRPWWIRGIETRYLRQLRTKFYERSNGSKIMQLLMEWSKEYKAIELGQDMIIDQDRCRDIRSAMDDVVSGGDEPPSAAMPSI